LRMLDVLTLRTTTTTIDENGFPAVTVTSVEVFCEPKGVKRAEYYAAQAVNQRVDKVFDVNTDEYNEQTEAVYAGTVYDIKRSYSPGKGRTELICTRR
jgi:SPP1 family predicted phage head-tail adaptor